MGTLDLEAMQGVIKRNAELQKRWMQHVSNYRIPPKMPMPSQPLARTCVSIPTTNSQGWVDIRITKPGDINDNDVYITVDLDGQEPLRFAVSKNNLMHVLSELAMEKLAK